MDFETVVAVADTKEIPVIKGILQVLREKMPNMMVTPLKFGKIGDRHVVTFKIDKASYKTLVEKLIFNKIKILSLDPKTKEIIKTAQIAANRTPATSIPTAQGWEDIKEMNKTGENKKGLEEYIREGNYIEVIKISKNINYPKDVLDKAKNNINHTVEVAINNAFHGAVSRRFEVDKYLNILLKIASDPMLKSLQKMEYLKDAGLKAVDACAMHKDYYSELVKIANNNALHNVVCIRATIKFAEIILPNQELYKAELDYAVRNLNIRWLAIALGVVQNDLLPAEIAAFDNLLNLVRQMRSESGS